MKPSLTFENGKFVLIAENYLVGFNKPENWKLENGKHVTTNFKAAAKWKIHADTKARKILNRAFVTRYNINPRPLPPFLDDHQKIGVQWILSKSRSYLAHAPGAGKTAQAITAAVLSHSFVNEGQFVIVVPPTLTVNWQREIEKFSFPLLLSDKMSTIAIVPESIRQMKMNWKAKWIIVPDSMLTRPWVLKPLLKMKKSFVAVDEASRFNDSKAQRTIALYGGTLKDGSQSPGLVYSSRHAVLLDGSPMPNRAMELWAPTYAMFPEAIDFLDQRQFGFRYGGAVINDRGEWEFKHSSREAELRQKLQEEFMHVVTEDELQHPERLRSMLFMTGDPRSAEHKAWEKNNLKLLSSIAKNPDEKISQGELAKFRAELGLRKTPWAANYIKSRLEKNEKIVVFCWHREVAFELEKLLQKFKPALIIGGVKKDAREDALKQFNNGKLNLIIGNIIALGRGHNIQGGDRAVFVEPSWTDELNKQCEKRISRRGNDKLFMRSDYIVAPDTMDELILKAVFSKSERVKKIIG